MGAGRARVPGLTPDRGPAPLTSTQRSWPLEVRRARADDRDAVLGFASRTWDGWDYVPHAWPVWLEAEDGVLLVGCAGRSGDGSAALDRDGQPLELGRPLAVARVAMLSKSEAWLEGIRVDPRVRGMDVATELQVEELRWAAARGAGVVRYATSDRNEGSHRLGARHGFQLLTSLRTYWWNEGAEDEDETGFSDEARLAASAQRRELLVRLATAGMVAGGGDGDRWWARLSADEAFQAGARLYEHRAWALQELTQQAFSAHLGRGEVLAQENDGGSWALAILEREALPAEDVSLHLSLLAGHDWRATLRLVSAVQRLCEGPIRFRLVDAAGAPSVDEEAFAAAGFVGREWRLDILGRPLEPERD
jgi:GNAT superfamily N-acetyltransferase